MNARDVKKVIDFEMIMNIVNLCFATLNEDADIDFNFKGKRYKVEKGYSKVSIVRYADEQSKRIEKTLAIMYDFGMVDRNNPQILIDYNSIKCIFRDFNSLLDVHVSSDRFPVGNKSIDDIKKNFDVTIRGNWGHLFYPLNEIDGSNISVVNDLKGGALIFDENGARYCDYFISNDGRLFYRGEEVPTEEELKKKNADADSVLSKTIKNQLDFYKVEYNDFKNVIDLRERVLNGDMETLFTKEEMFLIYLQLYKALVESKEDEKII